jgi:hypothetical protein
VSDPGFVGINATVSGTTLTATKGFSGGTTDDGFLAGAFSSQGFIGVTVSAVNGGPGSTAMKIGLNLTTNIARPLANVPPNFTYELYFHGDVGTLVAAVNGSAMASQVIADGGNEVGAIAYDGRSVVFSVNGLTLFTQQVPLEQNFLPLRVAWTAFYLGTVTTLTVTPTVFDTSNSAPYAALITSEHNQKPKFMAMVQAVTGSIGDVNAGIQAIQPAFDLDNAVGAQQDVIGEWVGQSRVIPGVLTIGFFGFLDDASASPFGELADPSIGGRFYELGESFESTTVLGDADYLTVLKAKIVRNQSDGTLADLEAALQFIFGAACQVTDNGTLSLAIHISTPLTPTQKALLLGLDILPRPAGVAIGSITF